MNKKSLSNVRGRISHTEIKRKIIFNTVTFSHENNMTNSYMPKNPYYHNTWQWHLDYYLGGGTFSVEIIASNSSNATLFPAKYALFETLTGDQ